MAMISFARIQEEQLNYEVRRTRVALRPVMPRPTAPSTAIQAPAPKKLTRDELRERSAKELCWHCDEPWSREHHYKKGRLLMIETVEDEDNETFKEALEPKEEAMEEESQLANYALILQVSHLKWKFKDDDSAQVLPTDTQADEELKTQFPEFMELQP
ncbi:hypothetical protein BHM03_00000369 [Ensete ventricosum]|nr:hypothetical protein BHM03_00000369 [Ensete ventricosum]